MLEAALDYARRGWPIFPIRPLAKVPLISREDGGQGVLDATTDPAQIRKWWTTYPNANIGLDVGGAGMMVVDHDTHKETYDRAAIDKAFGGLPKTPLAQVSPQGGRHEFFALNPGEIVAPSTSKVALAADVRSFHSYVLLAPSKTEDGAYTWVNEDFPPPKPAHRTDEMVRVANIAKQKSKDRDRWIIEPDQPAHVARAIDYLKRTAKPAIQGEGGDMMMYRTGAMMKSFGLSVDKADEVIRKHYCPRNVGKWATDEYGDIRAKIEHAYEYNTSDPGNMTDAYHLAKAKENFKPIERPAAEGNEITAGRFRIVDRAGMEDIRDPEWLLENLLPVGAYGMLVGGHGSFKTFVALDMALSVATGKGRIWKPTRQGNILLSVGEGRSGLKSRVNAWEKANEAKVGAAFYLIDPVPNVGRPEDIETYIKLALHMQPDGYDLVVIDTVGRAMQGVNENAQEHASAFTALAERIQRDLGAAVLALHHSGHEAKGRARGSSVFGADVDTLLRLDRDQKSLSVTLHMDKQKDAAEWEAPRALHLVETSSPKSLVVTPATGTPAPGNVVSRDTAPGRRQGKPGPAPRVAIETIDAAAMACLRAVKNGSLTTAELAERIAHRMGAGVSENTVRLTYLPHYLKCDARFKAHGQYDPVAKRWRSCG